MPSAWDTYRETMDARIASDRARVHRMEGIPDVLVELDTDEVILVLSYAGRALTAMTRADGNTARSGMEDAVHAMRNLQHLLALKTHSAKTVSQTKKEGTL